MKKKLLYLFSMLILAMSARAAAVEICGLSITDELAAQGNLVPALNALDGVVATGTVTYDAATQTLVLDNAEITYTPDHEDEVLYFTQDATNLTIKLKGTNKLTNAYAKAANAIILEREYNPNVTITGEGSLEVTSPNWYAVSLFSGSLKIIDTTVTFNGNIADNSRIGGTLEITNSTVTVTDISRLQDIVLNQCAIVEPADAVIKPCVWNDDSYDYYIDKSSKDNIVIKPTSTLGKDETWDCVYYAIKSKKEKTAMVVADDFYSVYRDHKYYIQPVVNLVSGSYRINEIGDYAFSGTYVTNVPMEESVVERIGVSAFEKCNLKTVTLPSTVKTIGKYAYSYCSELTDIQLNEGLECIDDYAFLQCIGLTNITIPSTVNTMVNAFTRCFSLKTVIVKRQQPADITYDTFPVNVYDDATLVVPDGTIEAYKAARNWKKFQHIVEQSAYDAVNSIAATPAANASNDTWYDLQGRSLPSQPTKHGLYIYKGKKVTR